MQYPIIDLITSAYINNGWTGLDISTGKNLFNIDGTIGYGGIQKINDEFLNTKTDTRTYFYFQIQTYFNNSIVRQSTSLSITNTGRYSLTINTPNFNRMRLKHNGSSLDLYLEFNLEGSGIYTISLDVLSYNPSIVNGLVFKNIQVEIGSEATPYEPYNPNPTNDFPNRLKLPLPHYFPHPVIDALQRAAAGTQTAEDTEILKHYLTPLGIGGI